jgi:hypothetical protein
VICLFALYDVNTDRMVLEETLSRKERYLFLVSLSWSKVSSLHTIKILESELPIFPRISIKPKTALISSESHFLSKSSKTKIKGVFYK